jgi:hypothetical protein
MYRAGIALSLVACNGPAAEVPQGCARGPGAFVLGDAQGDGVADIADAVAIQRAVFDAATPPACDAAVDLIDDGAVQADDASSLLLHLFEGTFDPPRLRAAACDDATPWPVGACGELGLSWETAEGPDGTRATLSLTSSLPVEAWSFGVETAGCELIEATEEATVAADRTADPIGLRDLGYHATLQKKGVVTQAVVLSLPDRVAIPADSAPHPLLHLTLTGACTLRVVDGMTTFGEPVAAVAVVDGQAVPLPEVGIDLGR